MKRHEQIESIVKELEAMDTKLDNMAEAGKDVYKQSKELNFQLARQRNSLKCFSGSGETIAYMYEGYLMFHRELRCVDETDTEILAKFLQLMMEEL